MTYRPPKEGRPSGIAAWMVVGKEYTIQFSHLSAFGDDLLTFGRKGDPQMTFKVRCLTLTHGEGEELHER